MIEHEQVNNLVAPGPESYLSPRGPFQKSHNLLHFYGGAGRGELLERLILHIRNSDETFWVRGVSGSGKTLLSLVLASRANRKFHVVRCDQHKLSANSLLLHLLDEMNPAHTINQVARDSVDHERASPFTTSPVLNDLQLAVDQYSSDHRPYLVIIDHPGQLSADTRILIGRLNKICRQGFPVFRVVVFETLSADDSRLQPALELETLPNVAYLQRFSLVEVQQYLEHHMMLFDYSQRHMFTREMAYFIADRSDGLVREISTLARNAFTLAGIQNEYRISMSHLLMAGLPGKPEPKHSRALKLVKAGGFGMAIAVASFLVLVATLVVTHY